MKCHCCARTIAGPTAARHKRSEHADNTDRPCRRYGLAMRQTTFSGRSHRRAQHSASFSFIAAAFRTSPIARSMLRRADARPPSRRLTAHRLPARGRIAYLTFAAWRAGRSIGRSARARRGRWTRRQQTGRGAGGQADVYCLPRDGCRRLAGFKLSKMPTPEPLGAVYFAHRRVLRRRCR